MRARISTASGSERASR